MNDSGIAIGYGETNPPGTAVQFAGILESEQVDRYRRALENLWSPTFSA